MLICWICNSIENNNLSIKSHYHIVILVLNVLHIFQETPTEDLSKPGALKHMYNFINAVKELEEPPNEEEVSDKKTPEGLIYYCPFMFVSKNLFVLICHATVFYL